MAAKLSWEDQYNKEIGRAILARAEGNEGMARVCARRAAGILIGEYLQRTGHRTPGTSAYNQLSFFNHLTGVDEYMKQVCGHFLLKVSQEHKLAEDVDLIQDAIWLRKHILRDRGD